MMVSQRTFDDDLGELSCDLPAKLKFDFGKILKKKSENLDFFYQNLAIRLQNGKQIKQNRSFLISFKRDFKDGFKNVSMSRSGSRNSILCQL